MAILAAVIVFDDPVGHWYSCSECEKKLFIKIDEEDEYNFCPFCGVKIDDIINDIE